MSAALLERRRLRRARRRWASMDGAPDPPPSPRTAAALAELRAATAAYARGRRRREAVAAVRRAVAERKRRLAAERERPRDAGGNREGKGATDVTEDTRAESAREEDPQRPHPAVRGYLDALAAHGLARTEEARERLAVRTAERRLEQAVRVRASAADALDRAKRALDAYAGDGPDSASALAAHARAEELLAVHRAAAGPSPEADGGGTADEAQGTDAPGAADGGVDAGAPPGRGMEVIGDPALARDLVLEMEIPDLTPDHLAETVLNAFPDDGSTEEVRRRLDAIRALRRRGGGADGGTQPDGGAGSPGGSPP